MHLTIDLTEADLRTLQVLQDRDRLSGLRFDFPNTGVGLPVVVVCTVAEVEARDVESGPDELLEHFRRSGRRSNGADDFRSSVLFHTCSAGS